MRTQILALLLSLCLAGCNLLNFPPIGPGGFPNAPLSQQQRFDLLLDSLNTAGANDFETVDAIRKYVALKVDLGESQTVINDIWTINPAQSLDAFENDQLTAECGLSAVILCKLLQYAGYESYQYTCGWGGDSTHKFTLVMLDSLLYVQDAFYDITIRDAGGSPKDFFSLISEIRTNDFSNILIDQVTLQSEFFVKDSVTMDSLFLNYGQPGNVDAMTCDSARCRLLITRNYDSFTGAAMPRLRPLLLSLGLPDNYLSLYPSAMKLKRPDGSNADSLLAVIDSII